MAETEDGFADAPRRANVSIKVGPLSAAIGNPRPARARQIGNVEIA